MPVSGLVIVLTDPNADVPGEIRADARFAIGEGPVNGRLPVVLETDTQDEDRERIRWLEGLPEVALVEIAYHDFSDTRADRATDDASSTTKERDDER